MNEVRNPQSYEFPSDLVEALVKILNDLPYGKVAPVAVKMGNIIIETQRRMREGNAKAITPKAKETGEIKGPVKKAG